MQHLELEVDPSCCQYCERAKAELIEVKSNRKGRVVVCPEVCIRVTAIKWLSPIVTRKLRLRRLALAPIGHMQALCVGATRDASQRVPDALKTIPFFQLQLHISVNFINRQRKPNIIII